MRIACPNCAAEYDVPDSLLASGPRLLRCAQCGHRFEAALPAPPPPEPSSAPPRTAPPPEPVAEPPVAEPPVAEPPAPPERRASGPPPPADIAPTDPDRPRPTRGLSRHSPIDPPPATLREPAEEPSPAGRVAAWLISIALLIAVGWATYTYHAEITEAWPPAARLYQALGMQ